MAGREAAKKPPGRAARSAARKRATVRRDPERNQQRILDAATAEFAQSGLGGARVDRIAARAGANKRMLYYYFGNKEALFLAVMEECYARIRRAELGLKLGEVEPEEGIRRLVEFTWNYFVRNPDFLPLLNSENLHRARHIKRSRHIAAMHSPFVATIEGLLARGVAAGRFRSGVDAVQLYISIASLSYFYHSNRYTLSVVFRRDLFSPRNRAARLAHMVELVLGYLRK